MASPFDEDWVMNSDDMDDAERAMLLLDNLKGNAVHDVASTVLSPTQPFDLWTHEEEASFLVDGHSNVSETQLLPFFPKWVSDVGPDAASCARALDVAAPVAPARRPGGPGRLHPRRAAADRACARRL